MTFAWLERIALLATEVTIVLLFLRYLAKRDAAITAMAEEWNKVMHAVSERCHRTQEAGHAAILELAAAIMKANGKDEPKTTKEGSG